MTTTPLLHATGLYRSYPGTGRRQPLVPVLHDVSLSVHPGEMVSIVGPSGSGKSTLLYCLSGLEPYDRGSVWIAGREIGALRRGARAALRRTHVGFIFQSFNLLPALSARENVALPARLARRSLDRADADRALAEVGLSDRAGYRPGQLSGGQQQRVAIARILATRPGIVFADEPTGALDTANGTEVLRLLREAASGDRAVVMVTHDLEAAALADRVLVLRDGVVHAMLERPQPTDILDALAEARSVA